MGLGMAGVWELRGNLSTLWKPWAPGSSFPAVHKVQEQEKLQAPRNRGKQMRS